MMDDHGANMIRRCVLLTALAAALVTLAPGQQPATVASPPQAVSPADDPSGMYSFLRDGEVLQLAVDDGKVTGFISRFGDADSDKGQFIDQFFDQATLAGDRLSFKTATVHGVWYEFTGSIAITPGKKPGQENYRVIKGTLVHHATDANGKDKLNSRPVEFKSFPQDLRK
jgi:hypothetical protein